MKQIIFLVSYCCIFFCCERTSKQTSIEGIWVVIENDSSYYEMVFTENNYWFFSQRVGEVYGTYKLNKDSLELINRFDVPFIKSKIEWINDHEFIANDDYFSVPDRIDKAKVRAHHYRLNIPIDSKSSLKVIS